jgi:formyltetrahydrofolate hydrolase
VGRPLPELKDVGINLSTADTDDKILLVSFFDMEQRPSRHCLTQLVKQAEQLKGKGVTVVAVQASKIDQEDLNQWVKKYNIPFPVGMVQNDEKKTRFNWGVKSLPWLILTDQKHIVEANGFPLAELDEKI